MTRGLADVCRLLTSWSCSDWRPMAPSAEAVMPFLHRYKTKTLPAISAIAMMAMPRSELLSSSSPVRQGDGGTGKNKNR